MKYKRFTLCAFFLSAVTLAALQAQNVIPAAGGIASGSGGSVSYSVGQVAYTTHMGTTGTLAQGVQHGYEIAVETGIVEAEGITLAVSVYPNPTNDYLILKVGNYMNEYLAYQLFDMNGRLLESEKLTGNETTIRMGNLASAPYFLKVIEHNKVIKTFKIIKK